MTPLLVFGPRSTTYDFGPAHPLTPRRFGPALDLMRTLGAEPGLAPEPVPDDELLACHSRAYIEVVRELSERPWGPPEAGVGSGDVPAFPGMHEAGSMVAGGSLAAMDAVLAGRVTHAFHPGGGLHHAMRDRASGFCIYNDVALAIARARAAGLRVLYVDLDVHHGDGVQALHYADPGVMTVSIHETGRALFPGTGFVAEVGEGIAAGTKVNLPLQPYTGGAAWLAAIEGVLAELAASFGPDVVVSQHGADSHRWDPLAHLLNTTTSMGAAARHVDAVAHRWAGGRWLSTGGGGYDAYRVVPRSWSLVWLAAAHREVPARIAPEWRARWAAEAERYGQAPLPEHFDDEEQAGLEDGGSETSAARAAAESAALVRELFVPALVRAAADLGWWSARDEAHLRTAAPGDADAPLDARAAAHPAQVDATAPVAPTARADTTGALDSSPTLVASVDAATWARLRVAPRVAAPADPADTSALVLRALRDGVGAPVVSAAVAGDEVVGLAVSAAVRESTRDLIALGVAPAYRGRGLATTLLRDHLDSLAAAGAAGSIEARVTLAERDVVAPFGRDARASIARRLLGRAGFHVAPLGGRIGQADAAALIGRRQGEEA